MCSCDKILCAFGCLTCCGLRNVICRKIVFFPPPTLYSFDENSSEPTMWLSDAEGNKIYPYSGSNFSVYRIPGHGGREIAAFLIRHDKAKFTIIFSHGNATDIGHMRDHLIELSHLLQVNILAYDYSGYGQSTGLPGVNTACKNLQTVFDFAKNTLHIPPSQIVLYGQSLGSGPSTKLASHDQSIAGLILHSPLMSGLRVIKPMTFTHWFDIFPNVDWIKKVQCPILIIHGKADQEIPIIHGQTLFENSNQIYPPWWVEGAGHNDIEVNSREKLLQHLSDFLVFLDTDST